MAEPRAQQPPNEKEKESQPLPKGVVLGKDGKPCRTCTSSAAWAQMMKSTTGIPTAADSTTALPVATDASQLPKDCPPDVERLGRHTWTLLHTLTATYPEKPTTSDRVNAGNFVRALSKIYPCEVCRDDFQDWLGQPGNEVERALGGREMFGRWACASHNAVNEKLGKPTFDCNQWWQRWGEGPRDKCG